MVLGFFEGRSVIVSQGSHYIGILRRKEVRRENRREDGREDRRKVRGENGREDMREDGRVDRRESTAKRVMKKSGLNKGRSPFSFFSAKELSPFRGC